MAMVRRLVSARAGGVVGLALAGAASAGVPEGRAALERSDYRAALTEFSNAAVGHDREAQYQLGLLYMLGHGDIPRDYARAAGWLRQADRKSVVSGKSVSVRVDLGGCRIIKTKNKLTSSNISSQTSATNA